MILTARCSLKCEIQLFRLACHFKVQHRELDDLHARGAQHGVQHILDVSSYARPCKKDRWHYASGCGLTCAWAASRRNTSSKISRPPWRSSVVASSRPISAAREAEPDRKSVV